MNRKPSLRDHPMIRCSKNKQQTDRGTLTEKCDSNKVAAMYLYIKISAWMRLPSVDSPYTPQNTPEMEHLRGVVSDAFTTHSSLILETNPVAVFKNTYSKILFKNT